MRFKPGHVLYGSRRTYLRKVALADFEGITANTTYVLESEDPEVLLPELLPFIMQAESFHTHSKRESKGSVNPYVNFSDLAWYEFMLPPLEEQRRIVEVFQAVEREREALEECGRSSAIARSSLANSTFLNHKWPTSQLGELLEYASDGPFGSKIKSEHYSDSGVRVIRLQNIDINEWNDEDKAFVSSEYFEMALKGYEVRAGDIVVAGLGDERISPGRSCVVPDIATPALNKADCFCLRPIDSISAPFLSMFLNSSVGLRQSAQFSQGTTRMRLNLGNIKRMLIPMPPSAEQENFVASMMAMLNAELEIRTRTLKVTALKSALLDGSLEVA